MFIVRRVLGRQVVNYCYQEVVDELELARLDQVSYDTFIQESLEWKQTLLRRLTKLLRGRLRILTNRIE